MYVLTLSFGLSKIKLMYLKFMKDGAYMEFKKFLSDWVYPIGIAILLALVINKFVFFNITVPTESMYPTIKINDRIIVTRIHNVSKLKEGDIVVFHSDELKEELVKRLIGLPGDKIEVKEDGSVYRNGEKLDEPYLQNRGGRTGKFVVPEGSYFFLGDNRTNSLDSRWWKNPYISSDKLMGKALYTIYPFKRIGKLK